MKTVREKLYDDESVCIPHVVYLSDFNTNYPNPNRIDRIASEINEYLKYKRKILADRKAGSL